MSMNTNEMLDFVAVARAYLTLVDATTISMGDGASGGLALSRNELAVLLNRAYREFPGAGTPPEFAES